MIRLSDIAKSYPGPGGGRIAALAGVGLDAKPGTVHGLLGENGAGKSTLMRVLYGLERPDRGTIAINGAPVTLRSPRDAARHGLGMVHQHFTLVPTLSVLDTCILGAGHGLGPIDRAAWRRRLLAQAERLRWAVSPEALVGGLGVGQQQRVEILKALLAADPTDTAGDLHGRALILDEPTAVLTPQEVDELLPALRGLAAAGATVLFISHKLHEVERLCDHLTILRRGRVVHDGPRAGLDRVGMARCMIGEGDLPAPPPRRDLTPGEVRLAVRDLDGDGLRRVSMTVRAGEVVGVAGVDGNGQAPLVRALLHDDQAVDTPGIPAPERLGGARRIGLIPDDRQHEALVLPLAIERNLALKDHRRPPLAGPLGWLRFAAWRAHARDLIARFDVRGGGPATPVGALSGGNQQKVVIARELHRDPGLIVAVNPTRGLDVAASAEVMRRLVAARDGGAGVLLLHHDLDELLAVADRVLVLFDGRLSDSGWPAGGRERIGRLMLGVGDE